MVVAFDAKSAPLSSAAAPLTKTATHVLHKKLKFESVLSPDDGERAIMKAREFSTTMA